MRETKRGQTSFSCLREAYLMSKMKQKQAELRNGKRYKTL
jgi:hypothetical protein